MFIDSQIASLYRIEKTGESSLTLKTEDYVLTNFHDKNLIENTYIFLFIDLLTAIHHLSSFSTGFIEPLWLIIDVSVSDKDVRWVFAKTHKANQTILTQLKNRASIIRHSFMGLSVASLRVRQIEAWMGLVLKYQIPLFVNAQKVV